MKICAVVVTYNRLNKLKTALKCYENQKFKPSHIIVVDNNSNDGTKDYLEKWSKKTCLQNSIISLEKNVGGSGGFYAGLKFSLNLDCDWIWISDDDAFLDDDCLSILNEKGKLVANNVGALCSSVYEDGKIALAHRRLLSEKIFFKDKFVDETKYNEDCFELNLFTYVGTLLRKSALEDVGLPHNDFFIWYDDTEHSLRVNRKYKIVCYPKAIVKHDIVINPNAQKLSWKSFYGYRNRLITIKENCKKRILFSEILLFKSKMVIDSFINRKRLNIKKDAYAAFKKGELGISDVYFPGKKI